MADLQITIPYKTTPQKVAFTTMCALFPVWSIIAPAMLGYVISVAIANPEAVPVAVTVTTCTALFAFSLLCLAMTAVAEDNRIHLSKDGVAFPTYLLPWMKFKRNRSWLELANASVTTSDGNNQLQLQFNSERPMTLNLNAINPADIEQLCLGIELWATNCQRAPELVDYQKQIQNAGREVGQTGYTQMWEEELSRRFSATSFIPLEPGHQLQSGRMKIVRQLAFGGLSAIYLAQDNDKDMVVIKEAVVPGSADATARQEAEQRLVREAEILSRLSHPNIARVLDHFVEDGRHYLKMQHINGQDLRQYVKQNGAVGQQEALDWALKIAEILNYLHTNDPPIIHRDLTPDNIVRTNSGDIVLIDFGAANVFVGAATGTIVGKQAFIPPEQLRGKSVLQSDIYAFGGTLYYLLTGKDPMPLAASHPKQFVDEVDQSLDDFVAKCTAFEPTDRFASMEELICSLRALSIQPTKAEINA